MKFLHTADWQVGMKAQASGKAGQRVREERLSAGRRVVEAAKNHHVEFVLVAGDVFEDNGVDRVLVQIAADIMTEFQIPVFVIPGNHDPLTPGSVWEHPAWKSATNVHILKEETAVETPAGLLYPCPVREKNSGRNPLSWIDREEDQSIIRVGLAHGSVEGIPQEEPEHPIPRDAAQKAGLDYLALGHWHSYATYAGEDGAVRMAYSGTPEPTKFGERDSGNALIVEIANKGGAPAINPVKTGVLEWVSMEAEVREPGDLSRVRHKIESLENSDCTLLSVTIDGVLAASEQGELDHIAQILSSRFIMGRLDASRVRPSPEDDTWLANLPPGIIREAAHILREKAGTAGPGQETAARALMELYAMSREVMP